MKTTNNFDTFYFFIIKKGTTLYKPKKKLVMFKTTYLSMRILARQIVQALKEFE